LFGYDEKQKSFGFMDFTSILSMEIKNCEDKPQNILPGIPAQNLIV